jgi:hypothetical protein
MGLARPCTPAACLLALSVAARAQAPQCALERERLCAPGALPADVVGWALAVDGDTLAVGAFRDDDLGLDAGSVHVFRRACAGFAHEAELTASDGAALDGFGQALALDGDTLLVGAYKHDAAGSNAGAAYVFARSGTTWSEVAELVPPAGSDGAWFGYSVALAGDTALVGAPFRVDPVLGGGAAFVFERAGAAWNAAGELAPANGAPGDAIGWSVALSGDHAAVGALWDDDAGLDAGAVIPFTRSGAAWFEEPLLLAASAEPGDHFGFAVALSGERLAIGARFGGAPGSDAGGAHVFERPGGAWSEVAALAALDGEAGDAFGWTVALDGDVLVVGAPFDREAGADTGAAYVFAHAGAWAIVEKLLASDPAAGASFGFRAALAQSTLALGAPYWKPHAADAGSVYVLELLAAPAVYCTAKPTTCGNLPAIDWSGAPSANASSGFIVSAHGTRAGKAGLLLYSENGAATLPFQGGLLCVAPPVRRAVASVDTTGTPGACDGVLALDVNAFAAGTLGGNPLPALRVPGTRIHAQFWGRDAPGTSLLSDALAFAICP